jgi:transcriptional regulator with XRE-family HTH domain
MPLRICKIGRMDIKETRKALGLSQTDLAKMLGISGSLLSRMESGEQPVNLRTILAMEALVARAERTV